MTAAWRFYYTARVIGGLRASANDGKTSRLAISSLARTIERGIGISRQAVESDVAAIAAKLDLPLRTRDDDLTRALFTVGVARPRLASLQADDAVLRIVEKGNRPTEMTVRGRLGRSVVLINAGNNLGGESGQIAFFLLGKNRK